MLDLLLGGKKKVSKRALPARLEHAHARLRGRVIEVLRMRIMRPLPYLVVLNNNHHLKLIAE